MSGHTVAVEDHPDFPNPPVVEVALSVQFEPLDRLNAATLGLFWSELRQTFPVAEQQPPLEPIVERFGMPETIAPSLRIELSDAASVPRLWLVNANKSELLQLQRDLFTHNWRKNIQPYPHYPALRESFISRYQSFVDFLDREDIGAVRPTQCEVTYINHIQHPDPNLTHSRLEDLLTVWAGNYNRPLPFATEDVFVHVRYPLDGHGRSPIGRLHLDAQPAFRHPDGAQLVVLTLTARGIPQSSDLDGILTFFDLGRDHILRVFVDVAAAPVRRLWESQP